ncbi:hypothetical protein TTHERM_00449670 (macronuclear) [Tetrahymena thermophila SB210]|uniref:50S ribosome-binding GTPase n=1 Tax=Tetrahymena thermophila (strain SB210) TaxID=312017 RepID=Q238V3_TETTS|nr:hypothetical protein TTHERM_00449670 [Tetrahymena thermophila SB210]EAR93117.3 hypothetical protein TTHERM_00449670 [Tetrahymena thermophila SB210]|eukprot:XP_001013362.3 hypothetical protein TTHERM_00449670 [Tetrahymena thermophila SB210]
MEQDNQQNNQQQNENGINHCLQDTISQFRETLKYSKDQLNKLKMEQKDLENFNKIFGELENQSKRLDEQLKLLHKILQDIEKNNKYIPEPEFDQYGYDMIIKMKSVFDLQNNTNNNLEIKHKQSKEERQIQKGLQIKYSNDKHKQFNKEQTIVGMQGQRNKGKTFILNSLTNDEFPSDYNVSTPGICLKFHDYEHKHVIYIDSEGLSCPIEIDYDNNENYKKLKEKLDYNGVLDQEIYKQLQNDITNKHLDQKVTEQLQQDFIIQSSHILLIVVSNLTQDDQKLIHTISQLLAGEGKKKEVYIVHNLKETHTVNNIQNYIEKLQLLYPLREQRINTYEAENQNNTVYIDCINQDFNHLIMAYSNSQAGSYYNQFTLHYLQQRIAMCQDVTNFNTVNKLQDYFNQNLQNFVFLKKANGQELLEKEKSFLEYDENNQAIVLQKQYSIEKVKELSVNVFGFLQKDCLYSIYNVNDSRILIVEIPGSLKNIKFNFRKLIGIFKISIYPDEQFEKQYGIPYASTRKIEEKIWNIRICNEGELWIFQKEQTVDLKNGLHKFIFIKDEDEQEF